MRSETCCKGVNSKQDDGHDRRVDALPRASLHNAQSGIRYSVYNIVERLMLDLLRKKVVCDTLEAHIAN